MSALFSKSSLWGHRFVFILNWKANCENNLKDIPVEGRHVLPRASFCVQLVVQLFCFVLLVFLTIL